MIKKFLFYLLERLIHLIALLPLGFLYIISNLLYYPLYYLIGYRKKVVRMNLQNSFPEKSIKQIQAIERAFYKHFCNYVVETIKLLHITDQEADKRIHFHNYELVNKLVENGQSVYLMLSHYGNWEWASAMGRYFPSNGIIMKGQIYHPLSNPFMDKLMLEIRSRFHNTNIPREKTLRILSKWKDEGKQFIVGFISDQNPPPASIHLWLPFLNQDTPTLDGVEKLARRGLDAVVYVDVEITKRGYIDFTYKLITDRPKETEPTEISKRYMQMLEETILRAPQYWLWTHKRWKRKRKTKTT